MTKIRKGTDIVLHITLNGNGLHTFGEIKSLDIKLIRNNHCCKHTHLPTKTSTNTCCCNNTTNNEIEVNSLVMLSDSTTIIADALFPADLQEVSGVYCLLIKWSEKTDNLIAEDSIFNYTINIDDDTFELVDSIDDVTTLDNVINITHTFARQFVSADNKYFKVK